MCRLASSFRGGVDYFTHLSTPEAGRLRHSGVQACNQVCCRYLCILLALPTNCIRSSPPAHKSGTTDINAMRKRTFQPRIHKDSRNATTSSTVGNYSALFCEPSRYVPSCLTRVGCWSKGSHRRFAKKNPSSSCISALDLSCSDGASLSCCCLPADLEQWA